MVLSFNVYLTSKRFDFVGVFRFSKSVRSDVAMAFTQLADVSLIRRGLIVTKNRVLYGVSKFFGNVLKTKTRNSIADNLPTSCSYSSCARKNSR